VYIVNSTGGRTITMHTENSHLCEIITNFAGGIAALNGLTANTQYFATGTSGTDFAISSLTDTHTFNLPTASATNRGALSSADWNTFSGKISGSGVANQLTYWNGTGSVTGSAGLVYSDSAGTITLSKNQNANIILTLSNTTSGVNSASNIVLTSDTSSGSGLIQKLSSTSSINDIRQPRDFAIFNGTDGDLVLANFVANRSIKFGAGGSSERMRLTGAGRLLIGHTSESTFILDVNGTSRFQDNLLIGNSANSPAYKLEISSTSGSGTAGVLIKNTGTGSIDFASINLLNNNNILAQVFNTSSNYSGLGVIGANGFGHYTNGSSGITLFADGGIIKFVTGSGAGAAGTQKMTLTAAGRLLLGTTSEGTFLLDVNGTARVSGNVIFGGQIGAIGASFQLKQSDATIALQNTGSANFSGFNLYNDATTLLFSFQAGGTTSGIYAGNVLFGCRTTNGKILFVQGNGPTSIGTWFSTGNLLIGSGSADDGFKLNVEGTGRVSGDLKIGNDLTGILLRATGGMLISRNGLAITNGNDADLNMTAGSGALGICELFVGTSTTRPLCLNKNGNEVIIGQSTATTNASSILTLVSTTKGFLPPRMTTTQKNAIGTPAQGLMVFDTTLVKLCVYNGTAWETITSI